MWNGHKKPVRERGGVAAGGEPKTCRFVEPVGMRTRRDVTHPRVSV